MHLNHGQPNSAYRKNNRHRWLVVSTLAFCLLALFLFSLHIGPFKIPVSEIFRYFCGQGTDHKISLILFNIRLPRTVSAILAGAGLSLCGVLMQCLLRNPLASPFTLGVSQAAAFGASLSIVFFNLGLYQNIFFAFVFALLTSFLIVMIGNSRQSSPQTTILCGVALGSLFGAGTMFLQYFADEQQLSAMIFWAFGDVSRAHWQEIILMAVALGTIFLYSFRHRTDYNVLLSGDEIAITLGVNPRFTRIMGLLGSSILTAVIVSLLGVIGFVGLVAPHMLRLVIGENHRYLLPGAVFTGALLLLLSDIIAQTVLAPQVLPVAIFTSFLGAPVFLFLIMRGQK